MSYFEFDETKAKAIAYGFWAAAEGRNDIPDEDRAFNALMESVDNPEHRAVFGEYYHIGHLEQRLMKKRDPNTIFFSDAKYVRLKSMIESARNYGKTAALSFISPDFAGNDPRFADLTENVNETWKTLLTFEWSYGYDYGLETLSNDDLDCFSSSEDVVAEIVRFKDIRKNQKTDK